jgi:hypothetical protein
MRRLASALVLGLCALACASPATKEGFAAASTRTLSPPMTVIAKNVEGRACGDEDRATRTSFVEAVADALRQAPGANALVNARFELPGAGDLFSCRMLVRGTAVRIESRGQPPVTSP